MLIEKACKQDEKRIYELYCASFPRMERKPFSRICRNCRNGKMAMWVIKEHTEFLGFFVCAVYEEMVLIDYFAVMPSKRGRGVGSQALKLLADIYPEQYIFLEIEPENEKASNALQRIRRKKFYLRCGFQETGILWDMYGVSMEVLCYQKQLTLNQCEKMYRYLYGRFWFLPIRRISHAHSQNSDIT